MGIKRTHAEANRSGSKGGAPKKDFQKDFRKDFKKDSKKDSKDSKPKGNWKAEGKKTGDGQKATLIFTPRPDWHAAELPQLPVADEAIPPPRHVLDELHEYANSLLEAENKAYNDSHLSSSSSHKFLSTIMASGTLEDKVSALTLLVQESPLHTTKAFENLLNMSRKKSRNQAMMTLGALKDLLGQGVVLPPDRKLRTFIKQPALITALQGKTSWKRGDPLPGQIQKVHLLVWAYEDWLKKTYFELLKVLEAWCNDEIEYSRSRAVTFVWELLKEKPEQEENLLRLLINKLGDTEKKIASRTSYLLLQLQVSHPLMKSVIINAIEADLLFKPGQSQNAKYYAIITLNQTVLSMKEQEVANKLLQIYFALFVGLLKKPEKGEIQKFNKKGQAQGGGGKPGKKAFKKAKAQERSTAAEEEMKEKLIAQILTGVNRAFPFAKTDDAAFESQLNTIFRVTHSSNFNTSVQALVLIQQISAAKHYSTDRFYRTLYESLLDPRLIHSSKQIMYLNLLYKSLKSDVSIKRVKAFVKRLLQIINMHEPAFACGVLYLISELITTFPSIKSMIDTPELNEEDEEEKFVDAPEDGADGAVKPVSAVSEEQSTQRKNVYDGRKRDPEHSNADQSCLWDLTPFIAHFHPSVSLFASRLLHQDAMPPKPDPTTLSLIHFLDRFAYRNPKTKQAEKTRGVSIMQPLGGATTTADILIRNREGRGTAAPVNSEAFWRKKADEVPVEEVFFHEYFEKSGKRKTTSKKEAKKARTGDEDEDEEDEEGEDEIWKALVESRPEIEGPDEGDEDLDFDDMMSDYEDSEGEEDEGMGMEGVEFNMDSEDEEDGGAKVTGKEEDEDDFDAAELESGDEAAFVGSDEELPSDMEDIIVGADEESEPEAPEPAKTKAAAAEKEDKKRKRRKLKHLPTFASAEDYAKLLEGEEDGF